MKVVTPQEGAAWCHLYDDSLRVIVGKLHAGDKAIVLPHPKKSTSWHSFQKVVTLEGSGWVEAGSVDEVEGVGEG